MSLVTHNFDLPFNILRCAYTELSVTNIENTRKFYVDILGLVETEECDGVLYLRALEEREHHCFVLKKSEKPEALALGFKVSSEKDLDLLSDHLQSLGIKTEFIEKYAQGRTLKAHSPEGIPLEFYASMQKVPSMLREYKTYKGAHIQRMDHFNCFTPNAQATYEFFVKELGFRLTEYTETQKGEMWAAWTHRKGNVHDMAFTNGVGPRLHHIGLWAPTALNIIHLCDVMATSGYVDNMERGPGRHGISNAFFLYLRDPDGHRIEIYTSDYLTVDTDLEPLKWGLRDTQRQTLWGQPAPESWFKEGSDFTGVVSKNPTIEEQPIIAH